MTTDDEKPKGRLSKIVKIVKLFFINVTKWGAAAGGLIATIYISKQLYEIKIIASLFAVLCIILLFISSNHERIRFLKFIPKIFILIFIVFTTSFAFLVTTTIHYPMIGSKISPGLTKEKISSLRIGMDKNEVISILGDPIMEIEMNRMKRLVYATPGLYGFGFEFYLNFVENKLIFAIIEKNDTWVYICRKKDCRGIINSSAINELISYSSK